MPDCSACAEGNEFSIAERVSSSKGDYDLLSTDGSGRSPTSVFADDESDSAGDAFWGRGFGLEIRGMIRTESYLDVAVVVAVIVGFTALCGHCIIFRYVKEHVPAAFSPAGTGMTIASRGTDRAADTPRVP